MPEPLMSWTPLTLQLQHPFRIAHGVSETRQSYWLRLVDDAGWGEGTIPPYYGVDPDNIIDFWQASADDQEPWPDDPADVAGWVGTAGPAPARCALDLALHDRIGREQALPLFEVLGLPPPPAMPTSVTIAIDTPEVMARMAAELKPYNVLKIKLGSDDDRARIAAIRAARPDALLRIDANAAWSAEEAVRQLERLAEFDLELVEQPVARDNIAGMGFVQAQLDIPVIADESVQSMAEVEQLAEAGVRGINLKLMKLGGLAPALAILRRARALGLQVMLGCMVETSLGVTAMAHLAGLADWLDLDAPLLIRNDPFAGLIYDAEAKIALPARPGIGVIRRSTPEEG